jgi:phytoene dehydrogenase-like protein
MSRSTIVIGAGLAGLAAAVMAVSNGDQVILFEATPHAGGRCRSWPLAGESLPLVDLGTHLILRGNRAVQAYLARIGAQDQFVAPGPTPGALTLVGGEDRLTVPLGPGLLVNPPKPLTRGALLAAGNLMRGGTVGDRLDLLGPTGRWFWTPLTRSILNCDPAEGDARLLSAVLRQGLLRGAAAACPMVARQSLSASLIEPALAYLTAKGARLRFTTPVRGFHRVEDRLTALHVGNGEIIPITPHSRVILAVPPSAAQRLLPDLIVPTETRAILNAHAVLPIPPDLSETPELLGLIDGTGEWFLRRGARVAITISAADGFRAWPEEKLSAALQTDLMRLYGCAPKDLTLIWEKRATFAATPNQVALRPKTRAGGLVNLRLAGDWTDTGLPATLEGAIRSGIKAAESWF